MPRYELVEGTSNKFWEIDLSGSSFTVRWGRIGTDGQSQTMDFANGEKARVEHDKLVAEKRKKGYQAVNGAWKAGAPMGSKPPDDKGICAGHGAVVVKDGDGYLNCLDAKTGKKRWRAGFGKKPYGIGHSGPIMNADTVWCMMVDEDNDNDNETSVCGFDLKSGKLLFGLRSREIDDSNLRWHCTPYLDDGKLHVQARYGIVALR